MHTAIPSHLVYIRLENIRETFRQRYVHWGYELPEHPRLSGEIPDEDEWAGLSIDYALGTDEHGAPCLYVTDSHRMTSPSFYLIRETGETLEMETCGIGFGYDPKIKGDRERREMEYYRGNRRVGAQERLCGLGDYHDYYPAQGEIQENLTDESFLQIGDFDNFDALEAHRHGDLEAYDEQVFDDASPFSLCFPCAFRALGLEFHSAGQYLLWLRAVYAGEEETAAACLAAAADDARFLALRTRCQPVPTDIHARRYEIRWLYEASRYKFLQNENLRAALCATRGRLVYASAHDDCWGRTPAMRKKREERGNCLGAALSLLRGDLHYDRESAALTEEAGETPHDETKESS